MLLIINLGIFFFIFLEYLKYKFRDIKGNINFYLLSVVLLGFCKGIEFSRNKIVFICNELIFFLCFLNSIIYVLFSGILRKVIVYVL